MLLPKVGAAFLLPNSLRLGERLDCPAPPAATYPSVAEAFLDTFQISPWFQSDLQISREAPISILKKEFGAFG